MSRYVFYLAVALLAFGIGVLTSVSFILRQAGKLESEGFARMKETEILHNQPEQIEPPQTRIKKQNLNCSEETSKIVWERLKKDKDLVDWAKYLVEAGKINDCQEVFDKQIVNLNDNKSDEIVLRGKGTLCSSGGDCQTWILSKVKNKYLIVLGLYASFDADDFKVLRDRTNRFKDIKIKKNNHRVSDTYGYFKFDGEKYRVKKCFEDVNSNELVNLDYEYDLRIGNKKLISTNPKNCL